MIKGITKSGFEFKIEDETLNDWELFEIFDELDENPSYIIRLAKKLLGAEQYDQLKKKCTQDGRVLFTLMNEEIFEILSANQETKN